MSHEIKLGQLIEDPNQQRDAIHVAVAPVVAAHILYPGQHVGFVGDDRERVGTTTMKLLGIVDPFLPGPVYPDQRCFMFLYQLSVTGMRHHWEHPAFETQAVIVDTRFADAKAVIEKLADEAGISYETMLEYAKDFASSGIHEIQGGRWQGVYAGDDFWDAYEIVTGEKVPDGARGGIFSCSC